MESRTTMSPRIKYSIIGGSFALASSSLASDLSSTVTVAAVIPAMLVAGYYGYVLAGKLRG